MTTSPDPPDGMPFLPSAKPGAPPLDPSAMALRDPEMLAATAVPYLPPAQPIAPSPAAAPVFDAKSMTDAMKRKVENPVYGHMPTGTPEGRAAAEAARAQMRRRRQRNKMIGRVVAVVLLVGIGAAGFFAYQAYQDDQDERREEREAAAAADAGTDDPAALTPLGEQAEVVEALGDLNSGVTPSAGGLLDAVEDAKQLVGQTPTEAPLTLDAVLPPEIVAIAQDLGPSQGFQRYLIDLDDATMAMPQAVTAWVERLQSLTPADPADPALVILPESSAGQIGIAVLAPGGTLERVVVVATSPDIRVNHPA